MLDIQREVSRWVALTFPAATLESQIRKLRAEVVELEKDPSSVDELADIGVVLLALTSRMGEDFDSLVRQKMEINRTRQWALQDDGTYQHVKEK